MTIGLRRTHYPPKSGLTYYASEIHLKNIKAQLNLTTRPQSLWTTVALLEPPPGDGGLLFQTPEPRQHQDQRSCTLAGTQPWDVVGNAVTPFTYS